MPFSMSLPAVSLASLRRAAFSGSLKASRTSLSAAESESTQLLHRIIETTRVVSFDISMFTWTRTQLIRKDGSLLQMQNFFSRFYLLCGQVKIA